jgi:hypothetical protein
MSANRLGQETSPYLLQHRDNPVHWWAWGPEALAEAKRTDKPILLSVGYAACHWCHVMAHESFEDEATAAVMNELFVNIKVDREERPDVDAIYMSALHKLGQQGGWPLTMFLDPDARPFWGGTYFPPTPRFGRPSFVEVLHEVERIYRSEPDRIAHNTEALTRMIAADGAEAAGIEVSDALLRDLTSRMVRAVDPVHGGINGAPKFPQWSFFWLLWHGSVRYGHAFAGRAVENTLVNICQGGIYDHLAGGFARYSVDEQWLVPHFEKMLYDNALLIDLMTEVWRETQNPLFEMRIAETVSWLLSEMVAEGGAFAASIDADSEGEEGKFYVWSAAEIDSVLGTEDAAYFGSVYDVGDGGNFEGHTILNRLATQPLKSNEEENRLTELRAKLLAARCKRVRPGWDDKILADWNGLMIAALSRAAVVFDRREWLAAAIRAFEFVVTRMTVDGRLKHAWRHGRASAPAAATDYANMTFAALRLHEATGEQKYLDQAKALSAILDRHYWKDGSGFTLSADDTTDVIVRLRSGQDEATPNANATQLANLAALYTLTGDTAYERRGQEILETFAADIARNPLGHCAMLAASINLLSLQLVVVSSGEGRGALQDILRRTSLPGALQYGVDGSAEASRVTNLADKPPADGRAAGYVCAGRTCAPPVTSAEAFRTALLRSRLVD